MKSRDARQSSVKGSMAASCLGASSARVFSSPSPTFLSFSSFFFFFPTSFSRETVNVAADRGREEEGSPSCPFFLFFFFPCGVV